MVSFSAVLVAGSKRPYDRWTFVVVPPEVMTAFGVRRAPVVCSIGRVRFRGTASRGEGVDCVPVPRAVLDEARVACGDRVRVEIELDAEPRSIDVPPELRRVLDADADLARRFEAMPPSMRRAWSQHVGGAKLESTRLRRAALAPAGIRNREFP